MTVKSSNLTSGQLFCILFSVRLFSLLLSSGSILNLCVKAAVSAGLSALVCLLNIPVASCRVPLCVCCIAVTVGGTVEYMYFLKEETAPDVPHLVVMVLLIAAVLYGAFLSADALARFSALCAVLLAVAVSVAVFGNLRRIGFDNLKSPATQLHFVWYEWLSLADIPLLYLLLAGRTSGSRKKALFAAVAVSNGVALAVYLLCLLVMGAALNRYHYPVFRLFQLASVGNFTRFDILLTGNELTALFLQSSLLIGYVIQTVKERKQHEKV